MNGNESHRRFGVQKGLETAAQSHDGSVAHARSVERRTGESREAARDPSATLLHTSGSPSRKYVQ